MLASTIFFCCRGCCPQGSSPATSRSSNHPYQSNIKAAHPAIHWHGSGTQTILSLPPPVLPDPLIRHTLPQNQATRFIDCTIEKRGLSARQPFRCKSKARDSQRDHWDLPDLPDKPGRLSLSALDDHVAKRVSMRKGAADRCWSVHLQHRQNKPRSSD